MWEKIVSTLHTPHSVAEDGNGVMKRLHCTLHTLHSPGTPAKGTATAPVEGSKSKGAVAKTKFPKIQEDKNHRETSLLEFHGDFYNAIIFQLDTKLYFATGPFVRKSITEWTE